MLDRRLVEQIASRLDADAGLVEKDWYVVRAISVLAAFDHGAVKPAFSGGTSLSKGWVSSNASPKRSISRWRSRPPLAGRKIGISGVVIASEFNALQAADFELSGPVLKADEDRFFSANFAYPSEFGAGQGLRPHLRVEMSLQASVLAPVERPIRSLIAELQQQPPEVAAFACVDAVETAADKLSALAWRVCTRQHGEENDDPTIIRHLHDLAALETHVTASSDFARLAPQAALADTGRRGGRAPTAAAERFAMMLDRLQREKFWADEYGEFVRQVSFARAG